MNKSNRHNLIAVLASLIAVVMIFGMAVVLGGGFGAYTSGNESDNESFENIYDSSEDTTVEQTAFGSDYYTITTLDQMKSFFNKAAKDSSGNVYTKAYLNNNIDIPATGAWSRGSNYALPDNYILDGNGKTVTYYETYNSAASPNKSQYGVKCWTNSDIHIAGTFLRAVSAGATLRNITFVQQNNFICKAGQSADALGMIGVNNGTMENVKFVLNGKFQYNNDGGNWAEKILGGLCAINNTNGKIYNCSAEINNTMNADGRSEWSGKGYAHVSGGVALNRGTIKGITVDYISTTPSDGYHLKQTNSGSWGDQIIYGYVGGVVATNDGTVSGVCLLHAPVMSKEASDGGWTTIGVGTGKASGSYYYYGSSVSTSASGYVSSGYRVVDSAINFQWAHTEGGSDCRVKIVPVAAQTHSDRIVWSMDGYPTLYTQAKYNPVVDMAEGNGASFGSNLTFGYKTSARRTWNVIDNETTGTDYNGFKYMGSNNVANYAVTYNGTAPKLIQTFSVETQGPFYQEINCSQSTVGTATATVSRVYEAQKIYDAYVADATVNVAILERPAKIKLPQFIYDRSGDHAGQYSIDGTTWNSLGSISDATIREFIVKNSTAYLSAPIGEALSGLAPKGTNTYNSSAVTNSYSKYQQPIVKTTSGTAITSQSDLSTWCSSGTGDAYLSQDFGITFGNQKNGSTYAIPSGRTLYGNGHTITVSYTFDNTWPGNAPSNVGGLFRTNAGTIRDLNYVFKGQMYVDNSSTMWSSPFVGENSSGGTITNCVVDYQGDYQLHGAGKDGQWYMLGGVVGNNKGTMSNVTFIMNSTSVLKCNFRHNTKGMVSGIAGENSKDSENHTYEGKIYGARYVQKSGQLRADFNTLYGNTPACSNVSAICANNNGTIIGQMVEGNPDMYNEKVSGNCRYFAMNNPSGSWTTSGTYCYLINGATCNERNGIVKIDVGYSDSVTAYNDVNVYFSETTSIRVNITLVKSIVDAGNKLMQVGPTNYAAQTVYSVYWEKPTSSFGNLRYGKTLSVDAIKTATESGAQQGIMEGDLEGIVAVMKSYLSLSGGASLKNALIAGYAYDKAALKTKLIDANSNYDYTIVDITDDVQDKYYIVGNIDIRFNDLYHVYGRAVNTWNAYDKNNTNWQYAVVNNQVITGDDGFSIDESLWLLDGTYYKTEIASYNNQVNAYTPTLSLDLSSDANYDKITYSGISDNNIKKLIKLNYFNIVTKTTTTNIYIGKEMNTGNVYDLSVSKLGTATFESFNASGYKFYFDPSSWKKSGVTYVGFAVAGNPANVDASFLDMSDANKFYVTLSRQQMETYFGTGNTFDLDLVYLYNATSGTESEVKEFLAGTSGKFGGAQKLTLTGNVTINSALSSSAVVFNQYKTLEGNGKTITLTSATGADYKGGIYVKNPIGYPVDKANYSESNGYPIKVSNESNFVYRGGLAAVSLGAIQNVNFVLGTNLGSGISGNKSYAIGGVVGFNDGTNGGDSGNIKGVKVTVNSDQTIGTGVPSVWGTVIGVNSGGVIDGVTVNGGRGTTISNVSGAYSPTYNNNFYGYIGGVVGIMNLTARGSIWVNYAVDGTPKADYVTLSAPTTFHNIYNMYLGDYSTNTADGTVKAAIGLICATGYVAGQDRFSTVADNFSNIVFFNKVKYLNNTYDTLPFFAIDGNGNVGGVPSAYGVLSKYESTSAPITTSTLGNNNKLMYATGITLKYDSYNDRAGDGSYLEVLDMFDYTVADTSVYFNRPNADIRNLEVETNSKVSGTTSGSGACVTFSSSWFGVGIDGPNTNQITAVLTMSLAVTTADGLNDFLKGTGASDPLMAIVNGIDVESDITINAWDNSTLLKVDAGRTLNGGNYTVTMNLNNVEGIYGKAYVNYSSGDKWNGYTLVYDLMGVNNGTIQNLTFAGQTGKFSSYDLDVNHIIGSLVAVNNGTINSVIYNNNGIGTYTNSNSASVNTIAGLIAGVNMNEISDVKVFNRAVFSVSGMFGGSVGVAMGAIAGVNDGGYAEGVKVFGDNAIELVSKTNGNTNTALYVGGVFGVANNYGSLTFAGNSIAKATADKAVISNANVIVAGGMGIRYSGGTIMPYGSRGIFAGRVTGELGYDTENRKMTGLAFMDMQTDPNLAVSYVYDAGVLSYFASDRLFNNSLTNGELTMMGYYDYGDTTPDTSCVSGGKVDIVDYHGNSIFMYNYDATTNTNSYNGKTFLSGLQNYMNGSAGTIEFDVKNVSSYLYVDDPMNMGIVCMSATLGSILTGTVLNYDTAKGLSGFATSTVNNVVRGVTYKYKWAIDPGRDSSNQSNIIQGFIEGKTATSFRAAGAALALTLTTDTEVSFAGLSAGRVLEAGRSINGGGYTLTVNVGSDTLNINEGNASNLYAIEGYDVVGVGGLFSAVQGVISDLNIVVNITGGTINATGTNLAVGGAVGIISGVTSTFGSVQVNVNGTTINFNDGGKTLAFGGAVGAIYNNGKNTSLTLNQNDTNYVYMKGVTMTGTAQNVAVGGAVGLLQGSMLQGGANPTVLYLSSVNRAAGTQGFDFTSTVSYSGTGGLGGLVGIMAGSTLQKINIDQGMSFAGTNPSQYLWTAERDMVWTLNGGSGSAVSAMGGAVGVSFAGVINVVGVNSRARLINNVGTGAGDTTYNYTGGLLGLGSNGDGMSLTGTADAYTETINGKTYTLNFTKINNVYAGQIGMIAMPDGGYAGYVTGRYINDTTAYGDNLRNLVWIDFTRKQADLFSKIQVFGATDTAGITLSNVAGMSVLGYVPTDKYNTLIQAGYNKSGYSSDSKLATYSKIMACDFKGKEISIALVAYLTLNNTAANIYIRLIGTMTANGYTPFSTTQDVSGTEYLKSWNYSVYAADGKTALYDPQTYDSNVLELKIVYAIANYAAKDSGGKHNYFRIQLFRNEVVITTETQLQEFISGDNFDGGVDYTNATAGVLGANITLRQEPNKFVLDKPLYGSNYTITLVTASASDRTNTISQYVSKSAGENDAYGYKSGQKLSEAFGVTTGQTPIKDWSAYLYGLFVGYISPSGGIYDVNFEYNQALVVTRPNSDGRYSMAVGIISALNSGTIQNCQLTLGSSTNFIVNRSMPKSENNTYESFKNICIAGGFTAMMIGDTTGSSSNEANMINCTLNMDEKAMIKSIGETHRNANMTNYPHGQTMAGGMVGWMGKNSNLINSTLNGGGLIEARTNMVAWFAAGSYDSYREKNYVMQQMYSSGAGALVGVNTQSYYYYGDSSSGADNDTGNQPYTNVVPVGDNKIRGVIDGVIINWYGFTLESITAKAAEVGSGAFLYCDNTYTGISGGRHGDLQRIGGQSTGLGVSLGYRQIAGICDWEQINNAYLVSRSDSGTTPCAYAGWTAHNVDETDNWFEAYTIPQGKTVATRYVGRGGEYTAEHPAKELYVYDNTNPDELVEINKDALGSDVSLSWAGTGIDAPLSFNFTILDPTAEGKFLWDTQVWQQDATGKLLTSKPEDAQPATEGDGWASPSLASQGLLFYNDVYNKINSLSDAIKYADVSQTFARGNNVYLYYSYGTTGSASIDKTRYYYDNVSGVYYDKYTTSFGNNFNMPALAFFDAQGNPIENSSISSTMYRSLEVYRLPTNDPNSVADKDKIDALTYYDKLGGVINNPATSNNIASVGLNDPVAGSYRISFNTESNASIGSAIKDIPSKTIIFPDDKVLSGNFKVVEIVTPFGLYATEMTLITEYKNRSTSSQSQIDAKAKDDNRTAYINNLKDKIQNIDWNNAGLSYLDVSGIGECNIKIKLEDWKYHGYLQSANNGQGGLGENRTYLINGSGFSLEYDFEKPANNTGIEISVENGITYATLTGRGLVIPTDVKVNYVQKTYDGDSSASDTGNTGFAKSITPSGAAITFSSFYNANNKNANAGNGKGVSIMGINRIVHNGNWFKIDRYYSTSSTITTGYGFRATTTDNWTNSSTPSNNKATSHTFSNTINVGSPGELIVDEIGTILPKCDTVNYIAKIYDGSETINYSTAKTSYGSKLPSDLKPSAKFGSANVEYGGQGKYNSIVFNVVAIQDMTKNTATYVYGFVDANYGNNYGISGTFTSTATSYTLADKGVIVPDMVSVTKVKKVYDNTKSFKTIGTTLNDNNMLFTISNTSVGNKSIKADQLGFNTSAGTFDTASVGEGKKITFTNATQFEYPTNWKEDKVTYPDRYFMTTTVGNYALTANQYDRGVIVPKELTWKDVKDLVYKTYDDKTTYTYPNGLSASTLFDGLVSGDTTTKPTITFTDANVNTSGVEISIKTTSKPIDATTYKQLNDNANYWMEDNTATGMILPATVTFSGITKVYDGNETLTDTVYTNMTTTVTNSSSLTGVKLSPVGVFDGRHAYQNRQVVWTTTSFPYQGTSTTYHILQDAKTPNGSGKDWAGNYCVAGNSAADITPCVLTQADFLDVTTKQNKQDGTNYAKDSLIFMYFAGAVYVIEGKVNKKNNADDVDGEYALYKSGSLAGKNTDGTYDVGSYDINVTKLTGTDADNYTLDMPFDLGQDLVINQQVVNSVAITVKPTNVNYNVDLPNAITPISSIAMDSVATDSQINATFTVKTIKWEDASKNAVSKGSPIGGYDLSVEDIEMSGNSNYKLAASPTYTVTVTPSGAKALYILPLKNSISKVEKVYDGNTNLGTVTATETISNYVGEYQSKNVQDNLTTKMGNVKIKVKAFTYYDATENKYNTKYVIVIDNADKMSNYYLAATVTDGYATLQVGVITPREVAIDGTVSIIQSDRNGKVAASAPAAAPGNFEYYSTATYSYSATLKSQSGNTGVISGDTVGVSITDPCNNVYNKGTYDLTFNGLTGADAGNYVLKDASSNIVEINDVIAQLTIKPQTLKNVSVSIKPINVVYGNAIPTTIDGATGSAVDYKSNDGVTGNFTISGFTTTATSTSPIGGYDITIDYGKVSLASNPNYVIGSTTTITVTVTPTGAKALYIIPADATINSVTKIYDGTTAFTGATIVTTPASVAITGTYVDKNAGNGKSVYVDVAAFTYYNTLGAEVSVDIFVGTNYKVANTHTTNANVATIDGVGVINKYAIKGSEITGVTVRQTWNSNTIEGTSFTYYTSAKYAATGNYTKLHQDDDVTITLGIYKSGEGYNDLTGTTGINVGGYKVYLKAVASTPSNYEIAASQAIDVTFTINRQEISIVNVVGAHYAAEYTGGDLTYDTQQANFEIYAIDLDGDKVDITGGVNGVKVGKDPNYANSQTQVGRYNVKVSVNGSAQGNYVFNTVLTDIDVVIAQGSTTKTEFAIYPKTATLAEAHKVYDGNYNLTGDTVVVINDANGNEINFGDKSVCARFDQAYAGERSFVFDTEEFQYFASGAIEKTTLHRIKIKAADSDTTTTTNYHIGNSNTDNKVAYIEYRPVTVTVQDKIYDGTTAVSGAVTDGIVTGETVNFEGAFADCNAGEGKEVRVYAREVTLRNGPSYRVLTKGGENGTLTNYCIAREATFTGNIAKREFTQKDLTGGTVTMINNYDSSPIEIYPTANTAEYSSLYKYLKSDITGSIVMPGATSAAEKLGNWTLTLYQSIEAEKNTKDGFAISVQMFKGNVEIEEDRWAQDAGIYTIKIALSGTNYFTTNPIAIDFVIDKQKVAAGNISVYMNSFYRIYSPTDNSFTKPSADGDFEIGIKDKVSGETVRFAKGKGFNITSLAFNKDANGTPQSPITATEGVYIGAYYLFAESVTGSSDNYDTEGLTLNGKAIFGIDNTSQQSMYYILPAPLNVTSVTKTYDGNTDTTTAEFKYNDGETTPLSATYASHMSTHNWNGSLISGKTNGVVNFKTRPMNVSTLTGDESYAIALDTNNKYTNYYVDGTPDGNGYIAVDGVGIIKKFNITNGAISLLVSGYNGYEVSDKAVKKLPINSTQNTATFTYANGHTYEFSIVSVIADLEKYKDGLIRKDDTTDSVVITSDKGDSIGAADTYQLKVKTLNAANYEWGSDATIGTLVINQQTIFENRVEVNITYQKKFYDGTKTTPTPSDNFKFVVKDFYTDRIIVDSSSGSGSLREFKYYKGKYENNASPTDPVEIGGYSVSVVVDTTSIGNSNYKFDDKVNEITKFAQQGEMVYFILPRELTVKGVYKEYDGTEPFVDMQVNGVTTSDNPKTIITIDDGGFAAADNTVDTKNAVYSKIIAAGGRFADKNIKVNNSQLVGGNVQFSVVSFPYYDEAGNSKTAYYIDGTNYTIAGTGAGSYVTVSNVGVITPVAVGYTSLTKTYDGTNLITYKASADYNKTTEDVTGKLTGDSIVGATGYFADAEVGQNKNVYLQVAVVTYKGISYYTLVNDESTTASNACNYYVFSKDESNNTTYPSSGVRPTDEGNGYVKIVGIGVIKKVAINIGGSTTTENGRIYDIKFQTKSGAWYAYNNTSAFVYRYNYYYGVNVFTATIGFNENQKTATIEYDGAEYAWAYGINGDKLYFKIYFNNNKSTVKVSDADDSYTLYIQLVEVRDKDGNVVANSNYELTAGLAGTFKINKQELGASNVTLKMDNAVSTTYNGKANNLTVAQITGISGAVAKDQDGKTVSLGGTITATDFAYVGDAPINVGGYQLTLKVSGLTSNDPNYAIKANDFYNVTLTGGSDKVYTIAPKEIKLASSYVKNFDGTTNFVVDTDIVGEKLIVGAIGEVGNGTNALAGSHTFAIGNLDIVSVLIDADSIANAATNEFNITLVKEDGTVDFATAIANYTIAADADVTLTINPSNIVVAERRYDGTSAEIEVAITGLAGTQFLNNTVDKTNLAGVLKISVNSFASFELATTDEIVESSIKKTESADALGYVTYTITFHYLAKGTLDAATYTDRYVFAVVGATDGYSTNLALTSSELADGQMGGAANNTGTAVATAEALATALKANVDIHLTGNIYGWDASALDSAINYTGTLQGNGYSIQLVGGLNSDGTNGGAFIASLGGTIRDVNFKFTSAQTLSATNVGLVIGNMTGNMTNVSLDIINEPTIDGATTIGGLAGIASGSLTNATVIFNASVNNANFGGLAGSATGATLTNVSVRAYNGKTTTGKTLVATSSGCTFNGVIDMIGSALGVSSITNLYTVNTTATGAKANGKLELLTPHTEGFIEYYFTTLNKTGVKTHNVYGGGASERDKTMYQTYGTIATNDTVALAIETLAPRNRFIWEAYSHSYQTEVAGGGHINLSLNRYVAFMPIGTVIEADGYTLDGQSKTDMSFITVDVTMFRPAIGIRGSQEIAASGSIIKEVEYTGGQISHEVSITVDGKVTSVSVSGVDAGYYDNIVVELTGDVTTDDINYDTTNRTAVVAKIDDGATVAGAILIIYPKQSALPTNFSKYYDTTSIGEFTTTVDGKSTTLLGTYVDGGTPASDVGTTQVSFANTLNPIRNVLVDKDGNYIAQHHKTEADGTTTFSYTKISVTTTGGVESYFTTSTDFSTINKNSLMRAIAQLIDYDKAKTNDATLVGNANYTNAWVYNVTAIKAADSADGYFDSTKGYFFVPKTIGANAGNVTFTADGLTVGSLTNIYIAATEPSAFAVLADSSAATIKPAEFEAIYTGDLEQCFRSTSLSTNIELSNIAWIQFELPTMMTEAQKNAFNTFKTNATSAASEKIKGSVILDLMVGKGISKNGSDYTADHNNDTVYLELDLPSSIGGQNGTNVTGSNYVIKPTAQMLKLRYFFKDTDGKYKLETYKDVLMIGKVAGNSDYNTLDYVMKNNINMKSSLITPFDWGNGTAFAGSIDGAGFALTNYILKGENNVGLFANMASGASVTNLIMGNVMVVATASSGEVKVSALTTNAAAGSTIDVATEMRVVTNTTGSVTIANAGQNFVRVHKQSASNKTTTVTTLLGASEIAQGTYLTPTQIADLTKFGSVSNFLDKYVFNNVKLTYTATAEKITVGVNNFREYWGWYNICPWLEGGNTWNGIRPTKTNTTQTVNP